MKLRLFAVFLFVLPAFAQQYDTLIRNGRLVDGSGNPWVYADVGIIGDRIAFVGRAAPNVTAKRTIDATGDVVAPGFIDMLGQSETSLLIDKRAVSKLTQGITTEITGEGESIAPQTEGTIAAQKDFLDHYHLAIDWTTLDQYFRRLEKQGAGINLGTYVGAAQLREIAVGHANRAATPQELKEMEEMVDDAMNDGALGISTALVYAPGSYASTEELIALAKAAAADGGIYASHIRNEADAEPAALEEAFRIGREAKIPVHIFHLKTAGKENWGKMSSVIAAIEKARVQGIEVTANQYPYFASASSLDAVIPPKYHEGGTEAFLNRLRTPAIRAQIRHDLETPSTGTDENWWLEPGGAAGIEVTGVLNPALKKYEGMRLSQIAALEHKDPIDALLDFVIADRSNTGEISFDMSEDDIKLALQQPWLCIGTDYGEVAPDGPFANDKSHPRAYGSFPRILGKYVRDEHVLRLEDAIRKFSALPAQVEHLRDRGLVRTGYFADITVFNPATVHDVATFEDPNRTSVGMDYVFVNGVLALVHDKITGELGGRPLRGPGYYAHDYDPEGLPMRGEVRGVITDAQGYPIARAQAALIDRAGKVIGKFETKKDGRYAIVDASRCSGCKVRVERAGFAAAQHTVDYNGANSLWFSFALKRAARRVRKQHKRGEAVTPNAVARPGI
jgi:N-acyl-D-amino-acid deacylase